jgi:hypothetical protein
MRKKIIGIFVTTLFIATTIIPLVSSLETSMPTVVLSAGTLDQKQEITTNIEWLEGGADNWQEFIPTKALLSEVEVHIGCYYSGSYPVTLTIEMNLGMTPPITTATLPCSAMPQNQQGWVLFDVVDRCLVPGAKYYIVLRFDPGSEYAWSGSPKNPYASGESNVGPMWDYAFRTYTLPNNPPSIPTITGKSNGKAGNTYNYTFLSTDPEGDKISYYVKWGDGNTIFWTPLQASGTALYETHSWTLQGTYTIEAKAQDRYGCQSDWGTLTVSMPKNHVINTLLLNFLHNYPVLYQIIQRFLKL